MQAPVLRTISSIHAIFFFVSLPVLPCKAELAVVALPGPKWPHYY